MALPRPAYWDRRIWIGDIPCIETKREKTDPADDIFHLFGHHPYCRFHFGSQKVVLSNIENHRILSLEKIVYTGVVKNVGNYKIGEVTFEVKIVNKAHVSGNVKAGSFYKPSGFAEFFGGGMNMLYKPQTITKTFVVAKNLEPGKAKEFRVMFDYPPYFEQVSHFTNVRAH